jgi:protein TonB
MTPLKDTLELGNLSSEAAGSPGSVRPTQESGRLRSDAVSLEVPVKVHGSRVTEVVRGITPHTEPFEEQSATMIVFPQGGVLKMSAALSSGQMVVITNLKSGQDAICRVVKVRPFGSTHSYVEIEFTQRQPGYWGVYFPSDGPELAKKVVSPSAPAAPAATTMAPAAGAPASPVQTPVEKAAPVLPTPAAKPSDASRVTSRMNPASAPLERHAQPNLPESRFVSIGAQEEVQPAASATTGAIKDPFAESERKSRAAEARRQSAAINFPAAPPEVSSPSVSMAELQGDAQAAPLQSSSGGAVAEGAGDASSVVAQPSAEKSSAAYGSFSGGMGLGGARPAPQEMFGVRLDSAAAGGAAQTAEPGRNWVLIAACVVALLAAIGGGAFYFYGRPAANRAASPIPAAPGPSVEVNSSPSPVSQPAISSSSSVSTPVAQLSPANPAAAMASGPTVTLRTAEAGPAKPAKASPVVQSQPSAPVQERAASAMPNISGALNAHPVSSRPAAAVSSDAAPSLDAAGVSPDANGGIAGMSASAVNLPAPPRPALEAPIRVGGDVKPPRMISSVLPAYPLIARQAGVQGSVVIETVVDTTGKVASMKVVSGPPMLRQAALDALRQWRYEPPMLNAEPLSVQMIVTIQSHR